MTVEVKSLSTEEGNERIKEWPIADSAETACNDRQNVDRQRCNRRSDHTGVHAWYGGSYGNQRDSRVRGYWVRGG